MKKKGFKKAIKIFLFIVVVLILFSPLQKKPSSHFASAQSQNCLEIGDLDCSGEVGLGDLAILLSNFGRVSSQADINSSGRVDLADISILLSNFGKGHISTTPTPIASPTSPMSATCYGLLQNMYAPDYPDVVYAGTALLKVNTQTNMLDYLIATGGSQNNPVRINWGAVSHTLPAPTVQGEALIYQGSMSYQQNAENSILNSDLPQNAVTVLLQTNPPVEAKGYFGNNFTPTDCNATLTIPTTKKVPSITPTPPIVWIATHEAATADEWGINEDSSPAQDSNYCSRPVGGVSDEVAHRGRYSLKMQIDTSVDGAGCRTFRYPEAATGNTYYYSAWFYFPEKYIVVGNNPSGNRVSGWTNLMQFKAKRGGQTGASDVFWAVGTSNRPDGTMYLITKWDKNDDVPGPSNDFILLPPQDRHFHQDKINIYPQQWFHMEIYVKQNTFANYDGHITVWQDGVEIFDMGNIVVRHPYLNPFEPSRMSWSMNSYGGVIPSSPSSSLYPRHYKVYVDDAVVSTQRIGPNFVLP